MAKNCILIAAAVDDDHETEVWFLKAQNAYCGPYHHYDLEPKPHPLGVLAELWTVLYELHEGTREDGTDISIGSMTEPAGEEDGLEKDVSEEDTNDENTSEEHTNKEDMMSEDKVNEDNVTEDAMEKANVSGTNIAESNQPSQAYEDFFDEFLQLVRNHTQDRDQTRLDPHSPSQHHHENEPSRQSTGQSRPMTMKMTVTIENHHREIKILYRD